jgi:DNA helicase-2/ATP-dependent DNA helicase PcrA
MYGRTMPMSPSLFLGEIDSKRLRIIGTVPRGFRPQRASGRGSGFPAGFSSQRPLAEARAESSDGRWALGDKVFNDDHGYGSITQIREGEDGPLIRVVFENGHELRFLSLHQSHRFTKIKED